MKIVFMGTPEFAVPSLDILVQSQHDVVAVITATDKMLGRGKKRLVHSPVKQYAKDHNIPVLQPKNLKAPDFVEELKSYEADLQVIVAFRMLPVVVWDMPPLGSINLHGSLLPSYRGAAPINWAVINGEKITGLTTFKLKHEIDTGSVIFRESILIHEGDTAGDVHDRLMYLGAPLVLRTVDAIANDQVVFSLQDESRVSHAPKIYHADGEIDFSKGSHDIKNLIHGMSPFPAAWTLHEGKKLKIFRAKIRETKSSSVPGTLFRTLEGKTCLSTADKDLELLEVQLEGKGRMSGSDFANGYLAN